jgi:hypothetical protein
MLPPGIFGTPRSVVSSGPTTAVVAGNFLSTSSPVARSATVVRSAAPVQQLLSTSPSDGSPKDASLCSELISPLASMRSELISAFSSSPTEASERPEFLTGHYGESPHCIKPLGPRLPYTPGETLAKSALFSGGKDGELRPLTGTALPGEGSPSASQAETEAGSPCWSDTDLDSASLVVSLSPQKPSVVIKLEGLVASPPALPSVGSAGHVIGACKPCAFIFRGGCQSGTSCRFCHLCSPGEKQRRRKERKVNRQDFWDSLTSGHW